jgi:hypothetical protein
MSTGAVAGRPKRARRAASPPPQRTGGDGVDANDVDTFKPGPAAKSSPAGIIAGAFDALAENQRAACKLHRPWILESMQARFAAARRARGADGTAKGVLPDAKIADVVREVMANFRMISPSGLAKLPRDGSGGDELL